MNSRSKYVVDHDTILCLFKTAGIEGANSVAPLGAGEFNSVYSVAAQGKNYAIKIAPKESNTVLTYEKDMMKMEVEYYQIMREIGLSVPKVFYYDYSHKDIPVNYFIMEIVDGCQLDKMKFTSEERTIVNKKIVEAVVLLHTKKSNKFGYVQNGLYDDWYTALLSMIDNLIADAKVYNKKSKNGERLRKLVIENQEILKKVKSTLVSFDMWDPNIFCKRDGNDFKLTLIDPERSFYGDELGDFLYLDKMQMSLAKKTISLETYNQISQTPVLANREECIRFALLLGYAGLIIEVEKYTRYSLKHFGWWRNILISKAFYNSCFKQLKKLSKNKK